MAMNSDIKSIIDKYELSPHPEGGFYKRIYESEEIIETEYGTRHKMTGINYLLANGDCSRWHRLRSWERWTYQQGGNLDVYSIDPQGNLLTQRLGESNPTIEIPPDTWFSAEIPDNSDFVLVSCYVYPGFDFSDFELANGTLLAGEYPHLSDIIARLS